MKALVFLPSAVAGEGGERSEPGEGSRLRAQPGTQRLPPLTPGPSPATGEGRKRKRKGLTLYEVILSLAIFLPALAVMGQAIATGGRAAVQARLQTDAVLRCESILAECAAGVQSLTSVSSSSFEDESVGWTWSLEVTDGPVAGLLLVEATVVHQDTQGQTNASCTLSRLLRDPAATTTAETEESL